MGGLNSGPKPDPERWRRIAELRAQGLTLAQIARQVGVTRQGVHHALRVLGGHRPARRVSG